MLANWGYIHWNSSCGWPGYRPGSCPKDFDKYPVDDCSWPSGDHDSCDPEGDEQQSMKLVILVRTDIKMTRGKACAQCSHAAVRACQVAHRYAHKAPCVAEPRAKK